MKILIIEDSETYRKTIGTAVRAIGHALIEAADAQSGLAAIEREKPDLLLLDVILPGGKDGYNIARTVRKTIPREKMKIIMVTTKGGSADVEFGKRCGADEYIIKKDGVDLGQSVVAAIRMMGA